MITPPSAAPAPPGAAAPSPGGVSGPPGPAGPEPSSPLSTPASAPDSSSFPSPRSPSSPGSPPSAARASGTGVRVTRAPDGSPGTVAGCSGCSSSTEGTSTTARVPPYGEGRRVTWMSCRAASRATTNRPSRRSSPSAETSSSGGLARYSLSRSYSSWFMPRPRSSTSTASPLGTSCAETCTWVYGGEKVVPFSISSAIRWITSATACPLSEARGTPWTTTRA